MSDALAEPMLLANLAGSLMVYTYEADLPGARETTFALAIGDAQGQGAFLKQGWQEALEEFRERGLISEDELSRLLRENAELAVEARRSLLDRVQERVYELLEQAIDEGRTQQEFAAQLRADADGLGISADDPHFLNTVFRTNVMDAYGRGRARAMNDPDVIEARPFRQIRTAGDARVRSEHDQLDGLVFASDGPLRSLKTPFGYNCFPGHVEVQGTFNVGMRALYDGEIVEITTKHGRRLAVTPNHPVATVNGFVAAGSIREGDQLLCYEAAVDGRSLHVARAAAAPNGSGVHEHDAPAAIEKVFGAIAHAGRALAHRGRPDEFHGDALAFQGNVDVVWAERELSDRVESGAGKDGRDLVLVVPDSPAEVDERGERGRGLFGGSLLAAAGGAPGATALSLDGRSVTPGPLQRFGFGSAANLHASRYEYAADGTSGDAQFVRDLLLGSAARVGGNDGGLVELQLAAAHGLPGSDKAPVHAGGSHSQVGADGSGGFSGAVALDDVIRVHRIAWRGHVYDLQSPYGWIVASGIVTSNCRCSIVSLGPDYDGPVVDELPAGSVEPGFG